MRWGISVASLFIVGSALAQNATVPAPPAGPRRSQGPALPAPVTPPPTPPPDGGALKSPPKTGGVVPTARPKATPTPQRPRETPSPSPEPEPAPAAPEEKPTAQADRPPDPEAPTPGGFSRVTGVDRLLRPWNLSVDLSTVSLFVPLKPGLTFAYAWDAAYSVEVSAMSGSLSAGWLSAELARYTETSYSVVVRSYGTRSSFHYLLGVSQENTRILIGNRYVDMATGVGSIDVAQTQSWALVLGLGQAWKLRNGFSFGIDYARIAYPLIVGNTDSAFLNSSADGDKKGFVADTLNTAAKIPRISFLQLNVGWTF